MGESSSGFTPVLWLAPMQGLTEVLFRSVYSRQFPGAFDSAISPFISLTHGELRRGWDKLDDVLPSNNVGSMPVVPQLLGNEPLEFVSLSNQLYDMGYAEVNWNIGCPVRKVAGKHRGSGILPYADEVRAVLDYVVPRLKPRLSVKMRIGYRSPDEMVHLIPLLNTYPLSSVIIHPRLGRQLYSGVPDMETFAYALRQLEHPVIYNGDITTAQQVNVLHCQYPEVVAFMIGRGALYDPLLPLRIKGMNCDERDTVRFVQTLIATIVSRPAADETRLRKIKEYWCLLYRALHLTEMQRNKVLHASTLDTVLQGVEQSLTDNRMGVV